MRQDSGFVSIYDENGDEIENSEVLFADEGKFLLNSLWGFHQPIFSSLSRCLCLQGV